MGFITDCTVRMRLDLLDGRLGMNIIQEVVWRGGTKQSGYERQGMTFCVVIGRIADKRCRIKAKVFQYRL